jgi:hypothetical protein
MPKSAKSERESAKNSAEPESDMRAREEQRLPTATDGDRESIARRAYERFQTRGGEHGRHEEDWLEAERALKTENRR